MFSLLSYAGYKGRGIAGKNTLNILKKTDLKESLKLKLNKLLLMYNMYVI